MKSMTGYGRARKSVDGKEISVEVRAVNHRYLDVNLKCPRAYGFLEEPLKKAASTRIARGKVDVFVQILGLGDRGLAGECQYSACAALHGRAACAQ